MNPLWVARPIPPNDRRPNRFSKSRRNVRLSKSLNEAEGEGLRKRAFQGTTRTLRNCFPLNELRPRRSFLATAILTAYRTFIGHPIGLLSTATTSGAASCQLFCLSWTLSVIDVLARISQCAVKGLLIQAGANPARQTPTVRARDPQPMLREEPNRAVWGCGEARSSGDGAG